MTRPIRTLLLVAASLAGLLLVAGTLATLYALRQFERRYDVPLPTSFQVARSPEAVERGRHLFTTICAQCHADASGRAAGQRMTDVPEFLGRFWTANVTSHPVGGVGAWSDAEIARLLRTGVKRDGRLAVVMPHFAGVSDADVAAIVAFMRSGDPVFAPVADRQPPIQGTVVGKLILTFVAGAEAKPLPAGPVEAPPEGPTAEYGRYLVREVIQCGDCHTAGFSGSKIESKEAFAGGFEFVGARGEKILSSNITPDHETGIGRWSEAEFVRALRTGIRPDGSIVRPPMITFRTLSEVEARAIHAYLRTLPPMHNPIARPPPEPLPAGEGAPRLFAELGCVACHGEGAAFREKLRPAAGRTTDELAQRILHPEAFNPHSPMPTFAGRIDEAQARALAEHVRAVSAALPAIVPAAR
jgi:mono/diheme cytochrome c family protein